MKTTTIEKIDRHYGKIWLLATIVIFTVLIVLGIWGFLGGATTAVKPKASQQTPGATQEKPTGKQEKIADKSAVVSGGDKVPAALTDAGEFGENIYDAAKTGDWKTASAKLLELKTAAQKMASEKTGSAEFDATLGRLEKAIAAKDKSTALIEANQLTLEAANLTAEYNPAVPVEVVKLDFYGRELEIRSAAKDEAKLRETARMIRQTWDAVKPKIEAKGGKKEAAAFESLVAKTDAARTSADYAKLATPILDEVDNLEKVFA